MQKGSAHLLLILLLVAVLATAGWFFLNNQNKNQKNLQISPFSKKTEIPQPKYSDNDQGFEFTYSKDLSVKKDSEEEFNQRAAGSASKSVNGDFRKNFKGYVGYEPAKALGATTVLVKEEDYETNPFSVWVFNNDNNLTIEQFFEKYWYYPFMWGVFDYTSKNHISLDSEATVSGQLAKSKIVSYQPGKPKFVYISKDQKMYLFRVIGETGEKIFSTIKL